MPRVSINLPVFNGGASLRRQLDSLLGQTFQDFQVILTDNASTDDTEDIAREYAQRDARILYHRNHKNMGAAFSYRRGFFCSLNADFMVYASHSDYWDPEYLQECVKALDEHPEAVLAYSHGGFHSQQPGGEIVPFMDEFAINDPDPASRYLTLLGGIGLCTAYYGLIRMAEYAEIESSLYHCCAALDNVVLSALAIRGTFIQIPRPLLFRERPRHGNEDYIQRMARILDMAAGDQNGSPATAAAGRARNNNPQDPPLALGSHLAMFFCQQITAHLAYATDPCRFDSKTINHLIKRTIEIVLHRYKPMFEAEIERSVQMMASGRIYAPYGQEKEGPRPMPVGQYPMIDFWMFICSINAYGFALAFLPNSPGLNHAMALAYSALGRHAEARICLERELELSPTFRPSLDLLAQYNKHQPNKPQGTSKN